MSKKPTEKQAGESRVAAVRSLIDQTATTVELLSDYDNTDDGILGVYLRVDGVELELSWVGVDGYAAAAYWQDSPKARDAMSVIAAEAMALFEEEQDELEAGTAFAPM